MPGKKNLRMKAGYAEWLVPVMEQRIAEYLETQVS